MQERQAWDELTKMGLVLVTGKSTATIDAEYQAMACRIEPVGSPAQQAGHIGSELLARHYLQQRRDQIEGYYQKAKGLVDQIDAVLVRARVSHHRIQEAGVTHHRIQEALEATEKRASLAKTHGHPSDKSFREIEMAALADALAEVPEIHDEILHVSRTVFGMSDSEIEQIVKRHLPRPNKGAP